MFFLQNDFHFSFTIKIWHNTKNCPILAVILIIGKMQSHFIGLWTCLIHHTLHAQWLILGIFVQKVFDTNVSLEKFEIWKSKGTFVMSIIKIDYLVTIFFQISYSLVPKIDICLKYLLDKNSLKQPLWVRKIKIRTPLASKVPSALHYGCSWSFGSIENFLLSLLSGMFLCQER